MAEAEDVIVDAARHATVFARDLWRRHRPETPKPPPPQLVNVAPRLELLMRAVFGRVYLLRIAQRPAPRNWLQRWSRRHEGIARKDAVPANDGRSIWLPSTLGHMTMQQAHARYRLLAMQQAMRAHRDAAGLRATLDSCEPQTEEAWLLFEADAADRQLARTLPGMQRMLDAQRARALAARRELLGAGPVGVGSVGAGSADGPTPIERLARALLARSVREPSATFPAMPTPGHSLDAARSWRREHAGGTTRARLWLDEWSGEWRDADRLGDMRMRASAAQDEDAYADPDEESRSARLSRRPQAHDPGEEDEHSGPLMIQTSEPHEDVEDPMGLNRPTDRDADAASEEFADALANLPEATLVTTPNRPREYLLSEDPPPARARMDLYRDSEDDARTVLHYPEWDWRLRAYRDPGAAVHLLDPPEGPDAWVRATLDEHRTQLVSIRRHFEMLRPEQQRLRRQLDGDDIDLDAWVEARADFIAGGTMSQALYQTVRPGRRSLAVMLLVDSSGSTDGWLASHRRVIDVEREALLIVCEALQSLREPWGVQSFSGQGPKGVTLRAIKRFDEAYSPTVARRIAALEPERYTRAGAAIRHASASLMAQSAQHRLLLLLSDGKPNDEDEYEGRYGVEDTRQAVTEAKLQGIHPFCLTIDRQAASYLPQVFGVGQYALLHRPEALPTAMLEWIKRLIAH